MAEFNESIGDQLKEAGAQIITSNRNAIFDQINKERNYQVSLWGQDRANMTEESWISLLDDYVNNCGEAYVRKPDRTFKERMLKSAAIAIAALEWAEKHN